MGKAISLSSEGKVSIFAPFLYLDKAALVRIGTRLKVPFEKTRTCYKAQGDACGKCGACCERLEAFKLNDLKDPLQYE